MLNARQRLLHSAFRRVSLGIRNVRIIRHPIIEIFPRIDAVAAIAHEANEMADIDFVTLAAAVLQIVIQQRRPEGR